MGETKLKRTNAAAEFVQYQKRLRTALSAAKICVFEVDLPRQLYTFFENAEVIFGISGESILRDVQPFSRLDPEAYRQAVSTYFSHPDDAEVIAQAFASVLRGEPATYEARMKAGNTKFVWCRINAVPIMEDGVPARMVGVVTDITEVKETTESLKHAMNLDQFTGLYHKEYAIRAIQGGLCKYPDRQHALLVMDIDQFKNFNDTYGHGEGDKVLYQMAQQLKHAFRATDVVGRFGGDEFLIFVQDIPNQEWLVKKLKPLTALDAGGRRCTASIGIACYPRDGMEYQALFEKADRALYYAKGRRENIAFFADIHRGRET